MRRRRKRKMMYFLLFCLRLQHARDGGGIQKDVFSGFLFAAAACKR